MKQIFSVLLLLALALHVNSQDLSLGLRAYYPFNGNANDASGYNNHPVFNNASLTADRNGNPNSAYLFNGVNSYMRILNSPSLNMGTTMSIAVKVKPLGFYTGPCYNNMILMKADMDYVPQYYHLRFSDVINGCNSNASTAVEQFYGYGAVSPLPIVETNTWYNVVWTTDGINARIYVNCQLMATTPQTATGFTNSYDLYIGHLNNAQYPYWLNGVLDEVRLYDRALTQDEVNLYSGCAAAPVTLTNFAASVINKRSIGLNWVTENESEMKEYVIQRSVSNENNFITIGKQVPANKPTKNSYTFTDNNALPNTLYQYRLEMVDLDGSKKYSAVKTAKIDNSELFITLVQNPAKNLVQFRTSNYTGDASLSLYNAAGMLVRQSEIRLINNQLSSFNTGALAKGLYWMHIQAGNRKIVEKIFLIN